jgi:hypothetical protein
VVNLRRTRAWSPAAHRTGITALMGTGRREGPLCQPAACSSPWPRTLCRDTAARLLPPGCSRCPTPGESSRRVAGDIHLLSTPLCMRLQTCLLRCRAASHPLIQTGSVANEATPMSSASRLTRAGASATIAALTTTNTCRSPVRKRSSSTRKFASSPRNSVRAEAIDSLASWST